MCFPSVTTSAIPSISVMPQPDPHRDRHLGFGDVGSSAPLISNTHNIVGNIRKLVRAVPLIVNLDLEALLVPGRLENVGSQTADFTNSEVLVIEIQSIVPIFVFVTNTDDLTEEEAVSVDIIDSDLFGCRVSKEVYIGNDAAFT